MALKRTVPMWALFSDNEQSLGAGRTVTTATTTQSREFMDFGSYSKAIFILDVSAITGAGASIAVTIQGFNEASGKWHTVVDFGTPITAVSPASPVPSASNLVLSANLDFIRYRAQWVTAGTGISITFTLNAILHTEEPAVA